MTYPAGPSHEMLSLLFEVTQTVLEPSDAMFHTEKYREYIKVLEWRIVQMKLDQSDTEVPAGMKDVLQMTRLYQLGALIYLERTSRKLPSNVTKADKRAQDGYQILEELGTCRWPFVLFIFGCEARSDEQRKQILRLVPRDKGHYEADRLRFAIQMVQFFWTQDDLGGQDLSYMDKLDAVMSMSGTVPAFV